MSQELEEKVARAVWQFLDPEESSDMPLRIARAALAVVREAMADLKPEMLGAWYRVKNGHHFHDERPPADTSDYAAYRAMLSASPLGEQ